MSIRHDPLLVAHAPDGTPEPRSASAPAPAARRAHLPIRFPTAFPRAPSKGPKPRRGAISGDVADGDAVINPMVTNVALMESAFNIPGSFR